MVEYRYSRESEALDGVIVYSRKYRKAELKVPCGADGDSFKGQERAVGKFLEGVVDLGFPERRRVVIFPFGETGGTGADGYAG